MRKYLLSLLGLLLIMLVMTYPLVFRLDAYIPGFFSTDEPYGALWDSWRIKYFFHHNLPFKITNLTAYPFGVDLYASGYFSYLWLSLIYFLNLLTTPVLTYNLQITFNLFSITILTCVLVYYLTNNRLSAIFSGIIFGLCPYQFMRIWQHLGLTFNQWIPLALLAIICLKERPSKKSAFVFLLSLLLLLSFDWSIMYLTFIVMTNFLIYILFYNWKVKLFKQRHLIKLDFIYFKRVIIIVLIAFVILIPQFFTAIKNRLTLPLTAPPSPFSSYRRPFEDLFSQSAKPLSYFLPASVHPVFGKFTENFIGSELYGESLTEHTLYLGWIPLILAFTAFKKWRRNRKLRVTSYELRVTDSEDFYIGFFIFLAIVAWFFSQPPWWKLGPIKIFMPSFFMYKILPMFRAYCRFGIVVMLAVAVLAGFGLKFILETFKTRKTKVTIATLFCGLVLFEFWNYPPLKVIDVSKVPEVYYWLKEQPEDIVIAEYPLDADSPNEMYKFYQTVHEKKIVNGTIPGTYANKVAQTIIKLSEAKTIGILKQMGVKYAMVHQEGYLQTDLIEDKEELKKIPQNPKLKLIKSFSSQGCPQKDIICVQKTGPVDVYEVTVDQ